MHSSSRDDLTTRARIRDGAIECFAREGFGVSVRTIAREAGVSPGLVIHHFGSKGKLREACDDRVRSVITELKTATFTEGAPQVLQQMSRVDEYTPYLGYVMNSLREGGPMAARIFDLMAEDTERYLAVGEEQGVIRPCADPAARARWLTSAALGSILLHVSLRHHGAEVDYRQVLDSWMSEYMLPAMASYNEPLFTDPSWGRSVIAVWWEWVPDPPCSGPTDTDA